MERPCRWRRYRSIFRRCCYRSRRCCCLPNGSGRCRNHCTSCCSEKARISMGFIRASVQAAVDAGDASLVDSSGRLFYSYDNGIATPTLTGDEYTTFHNQVPDEAKLSYLQNLLAGMSAANAYANAVASHKASLPVPIVPCILPDGWGLNQSKNNTSLAILVVPAGTAPSTVKSWLAANAPGNVCGGTTIEGAAYWGSQEQAT